MLLEWIFLFKDIHLGERVEIPVQLEDVLVQEESLAQKLSLSKENF